MARESMAHLIDVVRQMTGTAEAPYTALVTDAQIEACLDQTESYYNLMPLTPVERIGPGGKIVYNQFRAPMGDWEADAVIQTPHTWAYVEPVMADWVIGRWDMAESRPEGLYISGKTYDRFMAAALVCETILASRELYTFTFSSGGESFNREALRRHYLEQAKLYRSQAHPLITDLVRSDLFGT